MGRSKKYDSNTLKERQTAAYMKWYLKNYPIKSITRKIAKLNALNDRQQMEIAFRISDIEQLSHQLAELRLKQNCDNVANNVEANALPDEAIPNTPNDDLIADLLT